MRTDKKKSLAKVASVALAEPLLNQREIAEKAWVWLWTVNRALNDLEQAGTKDERIVWLIDWDFKIMQKIQEIKAKRLWTDEQINNSDLDKWEQTAVKRASLFWWNATDEKWWLKNIIITWQE